MSDLHSAIQLIDWIVIVAYAAGMLAIGWACSRWVTNNEDYFLGGRQMKPWAVGLSLFATLLSTLSYLAAPGEMIRHGPMIAAEVLVYPLIVLVVSVLIIPRFMKVEVTSAYEILEFRLGLPVRLLGAIFFLAMRLLWMALIIYATTSLVIVPLLGLEKSAIPYVSAALGIITIIYSSMGGFRAVVITDAVQALILLFGAVLIIVFISAELGGVASWWPREWVSTWDPPKFWFDPKVRLTFSSAFLAALTWYVSTAGSDQMAVQRYLATRDVKAARRMFTMSLAVGALAMTLLAIVGVALLAYARENPEMLAAGETIATGADQLLPRFIVGVLPPGLSGLVIAALLAAAMSSLSSGVSSAASVITVDFVNRFRSTGSDALAQVRVSRAISWLLGALVVALSLAMGFVSGNLLEVCNKVVNLLVAPLFVLFVMAMFVPWASPWGTFIAALLSAGVGIAIAFYGLFHLSFVWIMPCSLAAGVFSGIILSVPRLIKRVRTRVGP